MNAINSLFVCTYVVWKAIERIDHFSSHVHMNARAPVPVVSNAFIVISCLIFISLLVKGIYIYIGGLLMYLGVMWK